MPSRDVFVVGASAGGIETLRRLVKDLPADLPASLLVVVHTSPASPQLLPTILEKAGPLAAIHARDGEPLERGRIYVAPSDHHMLVEDGRLNVIRGPKENRHRPAIDPLFRSAAWAHGPRVVGVVLSGTMDDGAAGLWAIKSCGGITVVQDPSEALYPGMPTAALRQQEVNYCLPVEQIGALLVRLASEKAPDVKCEDERLHLETEMAALNGKIEDMSKLGRPVPFTCPACGGPLWELQDGELMRYRCHVGHAFGADSLIAGQSEVTEQALYAALRTMQEKAATLRRLSESVQVRAPRFKSPFLEQADELEASVGVIRKLLTKLDF